MKFDGRFLSTYTDAHTYMRARNHKKDHMLAKIKIFLHCAIFINSLYYFFLAVFGRSDNLKIHSLLSDRFVLRKIIHLTWKWSIITGDKDLRLTTKI